MEPQGTVHTPFPYDRHSQLSSSAVAAAAGGRKQKGNIGSLRGRQGRNRHHDVSERQCVLCYRMRSKKERKRCNQFNKNRSTDVLWMTKHCSLVNWLSRPCASSAEHKVPPIDPALLFDGRPLKQTVQNTVSGGGDGAGNVGDVAGATVGSPSHPHVPTANACAIAHCSSVYPDVAPNTCACPQVTGVPNAVTRTALKLVIIVPPLQMLQGKRSSVGGSTGDGGATVGVRVGTIAPLESLLPAISKRMRVKCEWMVLLSLRKSGMQDDRAKHKRTSYHGQQNRSKLHTWRRRNTTTWIIISSSSYLCSNAFVLSQH